jgi:hypothetical protein
LYTGNNARAIVAVYATPGIAPAGSFDAEIATQTPAATAGQTGSWFGIESRNNNVVGDPYLVGFGSDVSSSHAPVANQLTFAVASYDGAGTETLYWAFGPYGAIQSASHAASSLGNGPGTLDTASFPFTLGTSADGNSASELGPIVVLNFGLTEAQADAAIETLQQAFPAPEPSSVVALLGMGAVGLFVLVRRRRKA